MSYMYLVLAKDGDPNLGIRLMDVPVEWCDGRFVATGELQDRHAPDADSWGMLLGEDERDYPMQAVSIPDGWKILTNFWQPMRYVPSSREVRQYAHREAVKTMLELGITTPAQAQRLLESNDE